MSCPPEMEPISETLWFCAVEWDDGQSEDKEKQYCQADVIFVILQTQLYRFCISGLYWLPQSVSAVHISFHQVGH